MPQCTVGQIPTVCADEDSLENLVCCPITDDGECGVDANRGQCVDFNLNGHRMDTTDVRANWPHYFTRVSYVVYITAKLNNRQLLRLTTHMIRGLYVSRRS